MTKFDELIEIIQTLRHPETGCPWDKKQTASSLLPNFIEEVYEAVEAIEDGDEDGLCEELGDILLHIIFQVDLAKDRGAFTIDDVLTRINNKLKRRHPHIFGENTISPPPTPSYKEEQITETQVKENWEKIKLAEKKQRDSVLDGVPRSMPALIQAHRIQEKAAHIGFDWETIEPVFEKIVEEIEEVKEEIRNAECGMRNEIKSSILSTSNAPNTENRTPKTDALTDELGDLFFACVNLSRKLNIDAETALRQSTEKFKTRFKALEKLCKEQGIDMSTAGLEKLDELWEYIKKL